jgi:malonyl-ACP decarboxylase
MASEPPAVTSTRAAPIVVTGMGVLCALGDSVDAFGDRLLRGDDAFAADPRGPWARAAITGLDWTAAVARVVAGRGDLGERALTVGRRAPTTIRISLLAALEAWVAARADELASERVGLVIAGTNINQSLLYDAVRQGSVSPRYALQFLDSDHAGSVSAVCGIRGEAMVIGAGSASGNAGILQAARLIRLGVVDACLLVAAPSDLSPVELRALADLGALAVGAGPPARACRPFDAARHGFVPGEGAAALFLEPHQTAKSRGAPVVARIAGGAIVADGNHLADPSVEGQVRAMRGALADAGVEPREVDLISAHATSSRIGDAIEADALRQVFAGHLDRPWIVATKGLTGHCLNAAGAIGAVAAIVQMRAGRVHPNRNLEHSIAPDLRLAGPVAGAAAIDTVLSNAFSFGGIHTSVVLRRFPPGAERASASGSRAEGAGRSDTLAHQPPTHLPGS